MERALIKALQNPTVQRALISAMDGPRKRGRSLSTGTVRSTDQDAGVMAVAKQEAMKLLATLTVREPLFVSLWFAYGLLIPFLCRSTTPTNHSWRTLSHEPGADLAGNSSR